MRKIFYTLFILAAFVVLTDAQTVPPGADTVMILPFENTSGKSEFNWVGESFADSLADLLKVPSLNVVANDERKIIQQRLNVPLTTLPSLATSLKLAREGRATLLISGKYDIVPAQGDTAAGVTVNAKIIRVNEGRFLNEELPDGRRITRDINLTDALANLQTVEGQLAYQVLYQRDKALPFSQKQFIESANKVPARAFEAYIKGLLTPESEAQLRENYFKNAMRLYAEAKPDETYAAAALELGHLYLNQRQNQPAVEYFARVSQADARYAEAAFYTGLIYWTQENYEQALAVLRPLADDLKMTSVNNTLGAIAVQAARAEKNNKAKSAALLTEGIDFLKKVVESAPEDATSRFNYGLALFLNNDYKSAAEQFGFLTKGSQRDGEALYLLAKSLAKNGDAGAAEFDNLARQSLGNYARLETDYQRTNLPEGVNMRVAQPSRRDFVSVVLTRKQAAPPVQTPLNETEKLLAEARALYKAGRDDEAMAILSRVLVSDSMSAEAHLLRGNIHLRRGDIEQAVTYMKTALFWDNRLIEAHVALGKIFLERNDCLQAQSYSRSALALDEENQEALALERLVERCK